MRTGRIFRCVLALALLASPSHAAAQDELGAAVKATFLYRFASFVQWPDNAFASPDAPLVVCVAAPGAFAAIVERASRAEHVGRRPLLVRRVEPSQAGAGCDIVYLGGPSEQDVIEGLGAVRGAPILTVTDEEIGPTRGIVHFVVADQRVRFHIDRTAGERNGLRLNARLLSIALSVRGAAAP